MKKRILPALSVIIALIVFSGVATLLFATFFAEQKYDTTIDAGRFEVTMTPTAGGVTVNPDGEIHADAALFAAGDCYEIPFTLANLGDAAAFCSPRLLLEENTGLASVLLVYFDGEFIGVLGDLVDASSSFTLPARLLLTKSGTRAAESAHTLSLEYHVGAGDFYRDKMCKIKLDCVAVQASNRERYAFATDGNSFAQAIKSANAGKIDRIVVCNDITLLRTAVLSAPVAIDLMGCAVTVPNGAEFKIAYADATASMLTDSVGTGGITGSVVFDTPAAYVFGRAACNPAVVSYGGDKLASDYAEFLSRALQAPLSVGGSVELFGGFSYYKSVIALESSDATVASVEQYALRATWTGASTRTAALRVQIDGTVKSLISFAVAGQNSESLLSAIEAEFFFLNAARQIEFYPTDATGAVTGGAVSETASPVSSHILLPESVRAYGARVKWISEDLAVLGTDGSFAAPTLMNARAERTDGAPVYRFRLTAAITVNGETFARTYQVYSATVTPSEKLARLVTRYSPLVFAQVGQSQPLPKLEDYAGAGFSSITFAFDETLFELKDSALTLKRDTTQTEATVKVNAVVYGETVEDTLDVLILLKHTASVFDKITEFLDEELAKLPENVTDAFELPSSFDKTTTIRYTFVDSLTHAPMNPQPDYILISRDSETAPWTVTLDKYKLPNRNVVLTLEAKMIYESGAIYQEDARYFDLAVGGVYHNTSEDIPDVSLYYALMSRFNANGDDFLTVDEVANGVAANPKLTVQGKNIADLKGIEFLTGLVELDLSGNRLTELDRIGALSALKKLIVTDNRIRSIAGLKNTSLVYLDLKNNLVDDLSAIGELPLKHLDVMSNAINGFAAIEGLTALENLYVSGNQGALSNTNDFYFLRLYGVTNARIYRSDRLYSPSSADVNAMKLLANLSPVYEMESVLFLPASSGGVAISWSTTSEYAEIVRFENGAGRVYITQPLADVQVSIGATITYSGGTLTRYFVILSKEGVYQQKINGIDARIAVPDAALRYELFKLYGNPIAINPALSPSVPTLELSGKGVADLAGLELFAGKFTAIDLTNNALDGRAWDTLAKMTGLKELRIGNVPLNLAAFSSLTGLEQLRLFACPGTEDATQSAYLRKMFDQGAAIYPDGTTLWSPYLNDLTKALTFLDSYYILTWGGSGITLPSTLSIPGTAESVALTYTGVANAAFTLAGNRLSLANKDIPSEDTNYSIKATATYRGATVSVYITVSLPTERRMLVRAQTASGVYAYLNLYETMPDSAARRTVLAQFTGKMYSGAPYIDSAELNKIKSITFNGAGDYGVKGLELFNLCNGLLSVKAYGYTSRYGAGDLRGLGAYATGTGGTFAQPKIPNLVSVAFENSSPNLGDLVNLTKLTTLDLLRCLGVGFQSDKGAVFSQLTALTTVKMVDCDITETSVFRDLKKVETIWLYGNPISDYFAKFNPDMTVAYGNLQSNNAGADYDYRIAGKDIRWTVGSVNNLSFTNSGGESVDISDGLGQINYVNSLLEIELPTAVTVSGKDVPLGATVDGQTIGTWTSTAPEMLALYNGADILASGKGYATSFVLDPAKISGAEYGYVLLTLSVVNNRTDSDYPIVSTTVYFAFLVRNQGTAVDTGNVNFAEFLDADGKAKDAIFLNAALGTLAATMPSANGVFTKVAASQVPYFVNLGSPGAASGDNVFRGYHALKQMQGVTDIAGIRNFTGIYYLNFNNNAVSDISELRYLVHLEALYLENCPVTTFETHFTATEITDAQNAGIWTKKPENGAILTLNQEYADTPRQGVFDYMSKLHILTTQFVATIGDYEPIMWRVGVGATAEAARLDATKKFANLGLIYTLVNTNYYLEYDVNRYYDVYAAHFAARNEINDLGLINSNAPNNSLYYIDHTSYPSGDSRRGFTGTAYKFLNTVNSVGDIDYSGSARLNDLRQIFAYNDLLKDYERQLKLAADASAAAGKPVAPLTVRMTQKPVGGTTQTVYTFEDLTAIKDTKSRFANSVTGTDGAGNVISAELLWQEHVGNQLAFALTQAGNTRQTNFEFKADGTWGMKNDTLFYSGEQTFRMNCYIVYIASIYAGREVIISRIFDVRIIKDAVGEGPAESGQTVGTRVELTAREAQIYSARGVAVSDADGIAYAGQSVGTFYAPSAELIPDSTFRNLIYQQLKLTAPVVTLDMRAGYSGGSFSLPVEMKFTTMGIYDITGIELFTCVKSWQLTDALIRRVPNLPFSPYRIAGSGQTTDNALEQLGLKTCRYLVDLSGFAYDADGADAGYDALKNLPKLCDVSFLGSLGVGNAQLDYLFPLQPKVTPWKLSIEGTSITDLSFMATSDFRKLNFAEQGLGLFDKAAYMNYGNNLDYVKYMYLTNMKHNILTAKSPALIQQDRISIFFGELESAFPLGTESPLTAKFTMYGTSFGVVYSAHAAGDYFAEVDPAAGVTAFYYKLPQGDGFQKGERFATLALKNGLPYLTLESAAPEAFVLNATAVYRNPETGSDDLTFTESLSVTTGQGGAGGGTGSVAEEYVTEGRIELADGTLANLADVVVSPELRYHFLRDADADKNGVVSRAEQLAVTNLDLFSHVTFEARVVCRDLTGIERLENLTVLKVGVSKLETLAPLGALSRLKDLSVYNQARIWDFSFLERLPALEKLSLNGSDYTDLNFLFSCGGLVSLSSVTTGNTPYAGYVRNAIAYARAFGALRDDDISIGNAAENESSADAKIASDLLSRIEMPIAYRMGKTAAQASRLDFGTATEILDLPASVRFRNAAHDGESDYALAWQSLSLYLIFNNGALTVSPADGKTPAGMVATVEYNGARYDRYYFTVV